MIGFDIGGTKCAVCIGNETADGMQITDKRIIPTDHSVSPYEMIDRMWALAEDLGGGDTVGISCGGPLDSQRGVILSPPNLPGWDDVAIVDYLREKYGVKAWLQNDANACAVAEWKFGAGKGTRNMVFLTFGTGMGAGLILNGRLYAGASDMAGEIGHVRMTDYGPVGYGKKGSFEGFCSGSGIAQIGQAVARERIQCGQPVSFCTGLSELEGITAKTVAQCAEAGHTDALEVYEICGNMLGRGLAILIDVLNPECIVLGSVFQRSGHLLRSAMERVLERECLPHAYKACRIVPAKLEENIGDYAALAVGMIGENAHAV